MKNILFVIALPIEANIIKEELKNIKINDIKIDFLISWVGNYNTIFNLNNYILTKNKPDFIINIWVCWKIINENDFIQIYRIKNASNNKESLPPIYFEILPLKSILSSEKIITSSDEMIWEYFCDMESYWVDFIANKLNIPHIIIKKPFDLVSNDSKNVDINTLKNSLKWFDYEKLLNLIVDFLNKNSKFNFEILNIFKAKHKLTFSEFEMLKKYFNKEIAFWKTENEIILCLKNSSKIEIINLIK